MIPKKGDVVDINPKFKEAYNKYYRVEASFGEGEDGHCHITGAEQIGSRIIISLSTMGGYTINDRGNLMSLADHEFLSYGFNRNEDQFFVPISGQNENVIVNLKQLNSRPGVNKCAKCNGPLKSPWLNIKFCPVCEP